MDIKRENSDITAAISAVAAYRAGVFKRELVAEMREVVDAEVSQARLAGKPIDTTDLFIRLAEKYAN